MHHLYYTLHWNFPLCRNASARSEIYHRIFHSFKMHEEKEIIVVCLLSSLIFAKYYVIICLCWTINTDRSLFTKDFGGENQWVSSDGSFLGSLPIKICSHPGGDLYHGSRAMKKTTGARLHRSVSARQSPTEAALSILSNLTLLSLPSDHRPVLISVCVRLCVYVSGRVCACVPAVRQFLG